MLYIHSDETNGFICVDYLDHSQAIKREMILLLLLLSLICLVLACDPGSALNIHGECVPCPLGTASSNGAECVPCTPGTFGNQTQLTQCFLCPVNTFSDMFESTACIPCPNGMIAPNQGSTECVQNMGTSSDAVSVMQMFLSVYIVGWLI